jgi:hypothetical protein
VPGALVVRGFDGQNLVWIRRTANLRDSLLGCYWKEYK